MLSVRYGRCASYLGKTEALYNRDDGHVGDVKG